LTQEQAAQLRQYDSLLANQCYNQYAGFYNTNAFFPFASYVVPGYTLNETLVTSSTMPSFSHHEDDKILRFNKQVDQ
jgi:hypothetical protein